MGVRENGMQVLCDSPMRVDILEWCFFWLAFSLGAAVLVETVLLAPSCPAWPVA